MWLTPLKLLGKTWPYILVVALVIFLGSWLYTSGDKNGANRIQVAWNADSIARMVAIDDLQLQYDALESDHRKETARTAHELAQANQDHAVALATAKSDYSVRLRSSEDRAGLYKRQAESGPLECGNLASHAARLDRSLEEGRSLVRELRSTLGFRDQQIKALGDQILSDRTLLTSDTAQ